jgi:hypothetical protein
MAYDHPAEQSHPPGQPAAIAAASFSSALLRWRLGMVGA